MAKAEARLAFYREGGLERLLERYEVREEEKRLLYRVKRMVERGGRIDWSLVDEADEVIATIYRERAPKEPIAMKILEQNRENSRRVERYTQKIPLKKVLMVFAVISVVTLAMVWIDDFRRYGHESDYYRYMIGPVTGFFSGAEDSNGAKQQNWVANRFDDREKIHTVKKDSETDFKRPQKRKSTDSLYHSRQTANREIRVHHPDRIVATIEFSKPQKEVLSYCNWKEREFQYRFVPMNQESLSDELCQKYDNDLREKMSIKAPSSIVNEMQRIGTLEVEGKGVRCSLGVYTDRYRRYLYGFASEDTLPGCSVLSTIAMSRKR